MGETLKKRNCLFLDYDDCLVHSLWAGSEKDADNYLDIYGEHWRGEQFLLSNNERYITFLRNSTKEIIQMSRQLLGVKNVFILSTGTNEYVRTSAEKLELGFSPERILGRETLRKTNPHPDFLDTHNILVDNEFYSYHQGREGKIEFLNYIPRENYIQVPPFSPYVPDDEDDYAQWLTNLIVDKFNN